MKKNYENPKIEMTMFICESIMTASGDVPNDAMGKAMDAIENGDVLDSNNQKLQGVVQFILQYDVVRLNAIQKHCMILCL